MAKRKRDLSLIKLNIKLPGAWDELTSAQVSRIAYHLSRKGSDLEYLINLAVEFADLHPRGARMTPDGSVVYGYYHRDIGEVLLTSDHIAAMVRAIEWVTMEPQPMPAPTLDGCTSPDRRLYGVTLEQYITAETACVEFARNDNIKALRVMTAALYPRTGRYDPERLEAEADRLGYLPTWQLEAVALWFVGTKKIMMQKYPHVFSTEGGDAADETSTGADLMMGLLSSVNNGAVVDNDKLKQTDVHEIFYELNLKIRNAKKN